MFWHFYSSLKQKFAKFGKDEPKKQGEGGGVSVPLEFESSSIFDCYYLN
jgi:hypothetical protein